MAWVAIAIVVAAGTIGVRHTLPPGVVPRDAPTGQFSAERAMDHVRRIAAAPHPAGSPQHAVVRDYLVIELASLGMSVSVQSGAGRTTVDSQSTIALHNIVARRAGVGTGPALLLLAHYDAARVAPGAGDDASGVAAILETLRAIGPAPLQNDLLVVFTDGEELGLLGAQLLMRHPLARTVGLVLNFDARGNSGPSFLFQTSPGNAALIREVARVATDPRANSLAGEVYRRLPNDTDLSVFLREASGVHALNFAFVDGLTAYHTAADTPDALDQRSLQHHGSWALALTKHFGQLDLTTLDAPDAIYFSAPLVGLVYYPVSWALPLSIAVAVGVVVVVLVGARRGTLSGLGLAAGAGGMIVTATVAGLMAYVGWHVLRNSSPTIETSRSFFLVFAALAVVIGVGALSRAARRFGPAELAVASLALWAGLGVAAAVAMPGATWLVTWPAAFALAGVASATRPGAWGPVRIAMVALSAVPAMVLVPPIVWQLQVAMTNRVAFICTIVTALLVWLIAAPLAGTFRALQGTVHSCAPVVAPPIHGTSS